MEHRVVAAGTAGSPQGLRDLEIPPDLYVRGELRATPGVAIVGTRRATRYGIELAEAFGAAVARSGWSVVSGLARGIDAAAHRGCLRAGGHAVGVLGTGIDVVYPKTNSALFEQVLASGGALVSEYPPGTPPDRWRFPERNRIIAAVSVAVIVVEAATTGGALITARLGAEMGRPVLVVPGDVDRPASAGCNMLIRDGAHPVLGASDLLEELSLIIGPPASRSAGDASIPEAGIGVEALAERWSVPLPVALARVGRLELDGCIVSDETTEQGTGDRSRCIGREVAREHARIFGDDVLEVRQRVGTESVRILERTAQRLDNCLGLRARVDHQRQVTVREIRLTTFNDLEVLDDE